MISQYISAIEIRNFGIHKRFKRIEFCKTSNIIIGDNDAGKSTIFKALRLVSSNRPSNAYKKYANDHDKDFFIAIETIQDGNLYRIERTKKAYKLYLNDNLLYKFTKFGAGVPDPIQKALPLKDINWEKQIPKIPYLILETGGTANKKIIQAFGLIDQKLVQDDNKIQLGICKTNYKFASKEKTENKEIVDFLEPILEFKKRMEGVQLKRKESKNLKEDIEIINYLIAKLLEIKYIDPQIINSFFERIEGIKKIMEQQISIKNEIIKLTNVIERLNNITSIVSNSALDKIKVKIQNTESLIENQKIIVRQINNIDSIFQNLIKLGDVDLVSTMEDLKNQYKTMLKKFSICPLCGEQIKSGCHHLENIL